VIAVTQPPAWPFEQPAEGTLRPWYLTATGYLVALFSDPEEARRTQRGLLDREVPREELRLYESEEILRILSRLPHERSIVAKAVAAFATWLEDAGIPARVIDELMGHEATSRAGQQRGSAMGAHYRHTTPEMAARIATATEQRLTLVLEVAEQALEARPNRSTQRVFSRPRAAFSGESLANGAQSGGGRCVVPGGAEGT
jgi:hypothetical protein